MAERNRPVEKVRVGDISATIWEQENGHYNATLERNYRDRGGKWGSTHSFSEKDLLVVAKVADMAAGRISALKQEQVQGQEQSQEHEEERELGR
jgi:hypothetical protein